MSYERVKVALGAAFKTYQRKLSPTFSQKLDELYCLLERFNKKAYIRPTHNLLCECRKCVPSINTYWRYMQKELKWNKNGHLARR